MTAPAPADLIGTTAVDSSGDKLGKIEQVYLDDQSNQPVWVTVSTGLFGTKESFAPLYGAQHTGESLQLGVTKDQVKGAPNVDADGHLSEEEQTALYDYYSGSLGTGTRTESTDRNAAVDTDRTAAVDTDRTAAVDDVPSVGHDTSGPNTDEAITRSEEQLHVGTEKVDAGRAKLRKYIVTENVTQTVPVSHEEVRVEREPITDANVDSALAGADLTEEEHEVTLHAERPVAVKETVPVERVRLDTETVTEQAEVNETVRKEQIDTEGVTETGTRSTER